MPTDYGPMSSGKITGENFLSQEYWVLKYGTFSILGARFSVRRCFPPKGQSRGDNPFSWAKVPSLSYPVTISL